MHMRFMYDCPSFRKKSRFYVILTKTKTYPLSFGCQFCLDFSINLSCLGDFTIVVEPDRWTGGEKLILGCYRLFGIGENQKDQEAGEGDLQLFVFARDEGAIRKRSRPPLV